MNRRLPPLKAVRAFEAAARHAGIKAAAEELFVTPSAVSHQIKVLENFLGISLFRRAGRRIELSQAGERYLDAIAQALDQIDLATRRIRLISDGNAVNISVAPSFLTRWLVPRVRQFQAAHPDVELRLSPNSEPVDFTWSDIDMAIYFGDGDWPEVEQVFLHRVRLVPVCSPGYLQGAPLLSTPKDLLAQTLIDVSSRPEEWALVLSRLGVKGRRSGKRLSFSSTALAVAAAAEGLGVALADGQLIDREVQYGQLVRPIDADVDLNQGFYLVYQQGRPLSDGMRAFFDWMLDEIEAELAAGETAARDDGRL